MRLVDLNNPNKNDGTIRVISNGYQNDGTSAFALVDLIDSYISLIWTERYLEPGDFELTLPMSSQNLNYLLVGNYLQIKDSKDTMIIESVTETSNYEEGKREVKVKGRSLSCLLERRIVWDQTTLKKSNVYNTSRQLIYSAFINPKDTNRKMNDFYFIDLPSNDPITKIDLISTDDNGAETTNIWSGKGDNVLDIINDFAKKYIIGYEVTLDRYNHFCFRWYRGINRSLAQNERGYVVFSEDYQNLKNYEYNSDYTQECNIGLVEGVPYKVKRYNSDIRGYEMVDSEKHKQTTVFNTPIKTGLFRKEFFVDANDISDTYPIVDENNIPYTLTDDEIKRFIKVTSDKVRNPQLYSEGDRMYYIGPNIEAENVGTFVQNGVYAIAVSDDGQGGKQHNWEQVTELPYTDTQYTNLLKNRGYTDMSDHNPDISFNGECEDGNQFQYGVDYSIGDTVQVQPYFTADYMGRSEECIITEYIHSWENGEYKVYPTFTSTKELKDNNE